MLGTFGCKDANLENDFGQRKAQYGRIVSDRSSAGLVGATKLAEIAVPEYYSAHHLVLIFSTGPLLNLPISPSVDELGRSTQRNTFGVLILAISIPPISVSQVSHDRSIPAFSCMCKFVARAVYSHLVLS